ncbi:hypothetical protein EV384_2722 [Micromonospora kangleipakensis]|uniref:Uncharacterized protein n=1 Tax=Micromonospora kangleipakensis TaxID=1077942 RepID=A0A4Q8B9T8_9ACTN|nr:hypothetical protein [Micromonospora kangleipakensis]RZU74278.1 hypothetical protein EV384_2722 [Micromonospora kangleipakensis]
MVADGGGDQGYPSMLVRIARRLWSGAQVQGLFLMGFPPPPGRPAEPPPARPARRRR